jgi:hypothetical protein
VRRFGTNARYGGTLVPIAQRPSDLGALPPRPGRRAGGRRWFYFGYGALFTLHDDNG